MKKKLAPGENKRSSDILSFGEAFSEMLNTFKISQKFEEQRIIAQWEEITGKTIASRTSKIYIKDKQLFLGIDSAALKHQLVMSKTKLLSLLNEGKKEPVIIEIKFL